MIQFQLKMKANKLSHCFKRIKIHLQPYLNYKPATNLIDQNHHLQMRLKNQKKKVNKKMSKNKAKLKI